MATCKIVLEDNLSFLERQAAASIDLIYIDPPFNTGKKRKLTHLKTTQSTTEAGDRTGFGGKLYIVREGETLSYEDRFDAFIGFLEPRLIQATRILKPNGSLFVHLDPREVHYVKVLLDSIFGRRCFMNEIIWSYDFGGRSKTRWSSKHNNILWYAKDPKNYTFNFHAMDRLPYMAPALVGPEKAELGKTPTDSWWYSIVGTNSKERTGYPTQKPRVMLERIVKIHSNIGDTCLDFFAGSGSFGEAALLRHRNAILVDNNPQAIRIMKRRFAPWL